MYNSVNVDSISTGADSQMMSLGISSIGLNSYTFVVAIIVVICAIVVHYLNNRRFNELGSALPGPRCLPILGNMLILTKKNAGVIDMVDSLLNENPSICRLWMGPMLWVATKDAEVAKMILVDHYLLDRSVFGAILKSLLGDGLLTISPRSWPAKRKYVATCFGSTFVRKFVPTIFFHAKALVQRLESHQNGVEFNPNRVVSSYIFDAICESMFGISTNGTRSQGNDGIAYFKALNKLARMTAERFLKIWLHPDFIFNMTSLGTKYKEYSKIRDDFTHNTLRNKRKSMLRQREEQETMGHVDDAQNLPRAMGNVLEMLIDWINNGKKLSDRELEDEINTLSAAGLDTTSQTLCFVLLMLASHPNIQDRAYQELCEIFGNNVDDMESDITIHQLDRMEYLERVIKETMRVYPIVGFIPRKATRDLYLGKNLVPKGATLFVSVFSLHRDAKHWPKPLEFDPDRFLPEKIRRVHRYAYLPFGAGPRNCIGQKYAMLSMKIMCSTLLRKYNFKKDNATPLDNIKFKPGTILAPIGGIRIGIEPRIKK